MLFVLDKIMSQNAKRLFIIRHSIPTITPVREMQQKSHKMPHMSNITKYTTLGMHFSYVELLVQATTLLLASWKYLGSKKAKWPFTQIEKLEEFFCYFFPNGQKRTGQIYHITA